MYVRSDPATQVSRRGSWPYQLLAGTYIWHETINHANDAIRYDTVPVPRIVRAIVVIDANDAIRHDTVPVPRIINVPVPRIIRAIVVIAVLTSHAHRPPPHTLHVEHELIYTQQWRCGATSVVIEEHAL